MRLSNTVRFSSRPRVPGRVHKSTRICYNCKFVYACVPVLYNTVLLYPGPGSRVPVHAMYVS